MTPTTRRPAPSARSGEEGAALVVAVLVMAIMMTLGLSALAMTDVQTGESAAERQRESSFNLAEGALQQQGFLLGGRGWPLTAAQALPASCGQASTSPSCPTVEALVPATGPGAFAGPDYAQGATWSTVVRDNTAVGHQAYTPAVLDRPSWDENGDGFIWVRATATVRSRPRTLVALLKRTAIPLLVPRASLVAGALDIGQNGQPSVITTDATAPAVLRCADAIAGCSEYTGARANKLPQVVPDVVRYAPGDVGTPFVPLDTVARLEESAVVFTTCPTTAQAQGIVVIDVAEDVTCRFTGNGEFNAPGAPGMLVARRGTVEFSGNGTFHGMVLHRNLAGRDATPDQGSPARDCVTVTGNFTVLGAVVVEGACSYHDQGSGRLTFTPNNLNFSVTGVAGLVRNTWRELDAT